MTSSTIVSQHWMQSERQTAFPCYVCAAPCRVFMRTAVRRQLGDGLYMTTYTWHLCFSCHAMLKPRNDKAAEESNEG